MGKITVLPDKEPEEVSEPMVRVSHIPPHILPKVQELTVLIAHYDQMGQHLRLQLRELLLTATGINIADPGTTIEMESGTLVQRPGGN